MSSDLIWYFNQVNAKFVITWKSMNWFAVYINWLVSLWRGMLALNRLNKCVYLYVVPQLVFACSVTSFRCLYRWLWTVFFYCSVWCFHCLLWTSKCMLGLYKFIVYRFEIASLVAKILPKLNCCNIHRKERFLPWCMFFPCSVSCLM